MAKYTLGAALLALAASTAAAETTKKLPSSNRGLYGKEEEYGNPTYWPTYAPTPDEWSGSSGEEEHYRSSSETSDDAWKCVKRSSRVRFLADDDDFCAECHIA